MCFSFPLVWPWCISASHNARTGRPCMQWYDDWVRLATLLIKQEFKISSFKPSGRHASKSSERKASEQFVSLQVNNRYASMEHAIRLGSHLNHVLQILLQRRQTYVELIITKMFSIVQNALSLQFKLVSYSACV